MLRLTPTIKTLPLGTCNYGTTTDYVVQIAYFCYYEGRPKIIGSLVGHTDHARMCWMLQQAIFTATKDTAKFWDKDTLECIMTMPLPENNRFRLVRESKNGRYVCIYGDTKASIYDVPGRRLVCTFTNPYCAPICFDESEEFFLYIDCETPHIIIRDLTRDGCIVGGIELGENHCNHESYAKYTFSRQFNRVEINGTRSSRLLNQVETRLVPLSDNYVYTYDLSWCLRKYWKRSEDLPNVEIEPTETNQAVFDLLIAYLPPELAVMGL